MHNHKQLRAWSEGRRLVVTIYELTQQFPDDERFGLTAQLRRAAVSIPSNIAEGAGRGSDRSFRQYLRVAAGSASEVETQLQIAEDLAFVDDTNIAQAVQQTRNVKRMLWGLLEHYSQDP
jgi:four helix bundle protein